MKFAWEIADGMAHLSAAKVRFSGWSSSVSHNVALFQVQTQPRTKSMLKRRTNVEQVKVLSWKEEWCEPRTQRQKILLLIFLTILTSA